jgi:predicted DNA binding CopG/RHH family protein
MTHRTKRLVIRLTESEAAAVKRLAHTERLPASTLARQLLLREVDRRRLWSGGIGLTAERAGEV